MLNGNVQLECDGCDSAGFSCFPGAAGYESAAQAQGLGGGGMDGGMGGGMGGMGNRRVRVASSGAASLFTLPDEPRVNASLFSAPATEEDEKAARRLGGAHHHDCDTAACARVRLRHLREANAREIGPNGKVLAGGEEVPCEFQRVSRKGLAAMSAEAREAFLTSSPTVISGLADEWPARSTWADPQAFAARFGHHELKAVRASHGFGRLARIGGPGCYRFDESSCPGQSNATVSLAELVANSADEQIVIMDLDDMTRGEHSLLTDLSTEYEVPEFLECISNVRLLSLGGRPEGVQMSRHHSAWLSTLAGAKLWHLAPPDRPQPTDRYCPSRGKVDYRLAAREGVIHCVAYPGEVVVVPDNWWHATCNMAPYTLAIGGQTWDQNAGAPFAPREEATRMATLERWRDGRPRTLNHYQSEIGAMPLEVGERLPSRA